MTWDATAQLLAVKVIGTVESNMTYDAVNIADPITVGVAQWYGTRAANLLDEMKSQNPSSWSGVTASLENYIDTVPATNSEWDTIYLDQSDADSIKPILAANATIQNTQLTTDLQGYANVAAAQGMDINANTQSLIFWCTMYHQDPREALSVMASAGPNASLDRYYSICMNDPIFALYPNRYNTAKSLILSGDTSGVVTNPTPTPPSTPSGNGTGGTGTTQIAGPVSFVEKIGDHMLVHSPDGSMTFAWKTATNRYISSSTVSQSSPVVVQPAPNPTPPSPPPSGTSNGQALVNWMAAHADAYQYGQGPGRLEPDTSGYTDCSGLCYWCYMQVLGMNIGTWGGDQINNGTLIATGTSNIDTSSLQLGDLIFYEWQGGNPVTYDHTAMYAGNGQVWSHGGGQGPNLIPIVGAYIGVTPVAIMARRYI